MNEDCAPGYICGKNNCPEDQVYGHIEDCCTKQRNKPPTSLDLLTNFYLSQGFCDSGRITNTFGLIFSFPGLCKGGNSCCEGACRENEGDCDYESDCAAGFTCGKQNCFGISANSITNDDCCTRTLCPGSSPSCCQGQCLEGEGPCTIHTQCEEGFQCGEAHCDYGDCCTSKHTH